MLQNDVEDLKEKAIAGELEQHSQNEVLQSNGQSVLVVIHYEPQPSLYWVEVVGQGVVSVPGDTKLKDVVMQGLALPMNTPMKGAEYRGAGEGDDWVNNPHHRGKQLYECSLEELRELDAFQSNLTL